MERLDELGKRKGAGYKVVSLEQAAAFTGREPLVVEPRVPVRGRRRLKIAEAVAAVIEQRLAEENGDPEVVVENGSASEG
ncbi:hypothetical protein DKG75_16425 [Zavarzinia compransoris]|uniref:Uncharacterized protein n=1 Tax=Zavarzinia compransoris TaxID=1264899 RepID=A0A317E3P0_9PROT|nr:hypothetical protein DKG75_16425 [Zavarzinia compransoris]